MKKKFVHLFSLLVLLGFISTSFAAAPDWTVVPPGGNIQSAIDSVFNDGGGTVYLEAGTHNVSSAIQLKAKVKIMGAGRLVTIINYTGNGAAFEGTNVSNWGIKDLRITSSVDGENGILLNHGTEGNMDNLWITGFSKNAICLNSDGWSNHIIDCVLIGNNTGIFMGNQSNGVIVSRCLIYGNTENGIHVSYANGCQIMTTQFGDNGIGIHIAAANGNSSTKGLKITNNYFESLKPLYIDEAYGYAQSVDNLTFSDNYVWTRGGNYSVVADNPNGGLCGMVSGNHFWGVNLAGVRTVNSNDRLLVVGGLAYGPGWSGGTSKPLLDNNNGTSGSSSIEIDYKRITIKDVVRLVPRATAPSSPTQGCIYFNSGSAKLMVYDGTNWKTVTWQ